ncbi:MAG: VWA domain-containing protein [Solirubrobacteraceae bacterium]
MAVADRIRSSGWRLSAALAACFAVLLLTTSGLAAAATKTTPLTGWLGGGTTFPSRALVVLPPSGSKVTPSTVHVTENGKPTGALTVTPTTQAGLGDFGLVVVLDQNASMKGAGLAAAISASRALTALRTGQQQLGVVTFASQANLLAPLSTDSTSLNTALSAQPSTGSGANAPAGIQLALSTLNQARVALGAIVLVSDGVGALTPGSPTAAAVQSEAASASVPIFTVGLQDKAATASSLAALAKVAPGQFIQTPPARLSSVLKEIQGIVTRGYVVRWRSTAQPGQPVNVAARIDGTPGTIAVSYHAVGTPAAHPSAPAHGAAQPVTTTSQLSQTPSFAPAPAKAAASTAPAAPAQAAPASFWSSSRATPIIAGLVGLLVAVAVALLLYRPSNRAVRVRVGSFIPSALDSEPDALVPVPTPRQGLLERQRFWAPFVLSVEIAHGPRTPIYLVKRAALIAVVLAVVAVVVAGSMLIAFIPLLGWPFALKKAMSRAAEKQREKFRETLPGYLQDLASAMRVGRSFIGAMTVVVDSAEEPTKSELGRVITDEAFGRPVDEALDAVAERLNAPDLGQIALIAALNRRSGSNVAEALDRVAEGARERADLKREVRALTAQAKMSSMVLTALPGVLLVGLMLISPLYAHPLFHTTIGVVLLGVGAIMCFAGWKAMGKITNVNV